MPEGTTVDIAFLVDAATADLLHGVQVDHSPDERQWVSTALTLYDESIKVPSVPASCSTLLPQAYGGGRGRADGMWFSLARRCLIRAVSTCYNDELERDGTLENTRGLGEDVLCQIVANVA